MVKLDVSLLRYLDKDDFRVLTAIEMGMRNHELVPRSLVYSISGIQNGSISKILLNLSKNQLLSYERGKRYDGYRLTYRGYDYLALNVLRSRGVISSVGQQIGVGKESDVYICSNDEDRQFAIKFHRLGRTCFRRVSDKRDYYQRRGANHKTASWIYLSRLAATREFAFMKLLYGQKLLPVPEPIDMNRHCIVMELIDGTILNQVYLDNDNEQQQIELLYEKLMSLMMKLTNEFGVVHGDFNEFNIMIRKLKEGSLDPILIDFPQMISIHHELAQEYFDRDRDCIVDFFAKRFHYESDFIPVFEPFAEATTTDLQQLADAFDDANEETFDSNPKTKQSENSSMTDGKSELLSKFLNSLCSTNDADNIDHKSTMIDNDAAPNLYYCLKNDQDINEEIEILDERMAKLAPTSSIEKNDNDDENAEVKISNTLNHNDRDDAYSTATSTFSPQTIKSRLLKEQRKKETRQRIKMAANVKKNVKGDSNALRRRKRDDYQSAKEDWHAFKDAVIDG
ncbi:serine/threonine-protein kinase RIO2-like protein [Euroglyphus maynei]|uniref:Serine/threonine-protein kinase RIO2 n=1 Tax=Euroglyphus maynei TaxID=6958 RepID=A0A1Y3BNY8_EURMA|nr:serine/threonine-protein kinase RIO2-like protein [Euroglyphus maynei]